MPSAYQHAAGAAGAAGAALGPECACPTVFDQVLRLGGVRPDDKYGKPGHTELLYR
jgi:hypothetical protein